MPTSRFMPRPRAPLNRAGDPLAGRDKALAAPGSPEMSALFRPPTPAAPTFRAASTGWEAPSLSSLGKTLAQYGSGGKPGVAQVSYPTRQIAPSPFAADEYTDNTAAAMGVAQNTGGSEGPVGASGPVSPTLETPDPVESPNIDASPVVALSTPSASSAPKMSDNDYASNALSEMDDMMALLEGGSTAAVAASPPTDSGNTELMGPPISARPRDRSWMFQPRDSREPIKFNNPVADKPWGAALDQRPGSNEPSNATYRYYERAAARGRRQGAGSADNRRVLRFDNRGR